ncbi:hypothetical protein KV102_17820 [Mumia sp. zg.B53]|uniref:hypothetical protein n=1 Tax=Mumia sp. zg.B53 TaxID=2855449 RepID=UPI001C6E3C04|nr:hypothetical protein [Mumia sp. zg.B53]MBW9216702.1 hypothetical protein [Mumia sp. zg.B53]
MIPVSQAVTSWLPDDLERRQKARALAGSLVVVQLALRAWAVFGGFFLLDDFKMLSQATERGLTRSLLLEPYDDKLMPGGRLIGWLVSEAGPFNWTAAAWTLIALQAVASILCWVMLSTLFGERLATLVPFAVFLFTPMTLTALMWWAAGINLLPVQIAFFVAVTGHVAYLRSGALRHALVATVGLAGGLLFYDKALLIALVLPFLAVAYFRRGPLPSRLLGALRQWWKGWALYALVLAGYLGYRLAFVDSPVATTGDLRLGLIMQTLLVESFPVSLLGGPWAWDPAAAPTVGIDPPLVLWAASLILLAAVVATGFLLRVRTGRAWVLLGAYLLCEGVLLALGRGSAAGEMAAHELRYLADVAPVTVLVLGLAFLRLRGAPDSSAPRREPLLAVVPSRSAIVAVMALLLIGSVVSTVRYVNFWHADFPARVYVTNAMKAVQGEGRLTIADENVPASTMWPLLYPATLPSHFFAPLPQITAVDAGTNLETLTEAGIPVSAGVTPNIVGEAAPGAEPGCIASLSEGDRVSVSTSGPVPGYAPWIYLQYRAETSGTVVVSYGGNADEIPLDAGVNTYVVRNDTTFRHMVFDDLRGGDLCVTSLQIGNLVAVQ